MAGTRQGSIGSHRDLPGARTPRERGWPRTRGQQNLPGNIDPMQSAFPHVRSPVNVRGMLAFMPTASPDPKTATHPRINKEALAVFFTPAALADINEGNEQQDALPHQGTGKADAEAHAMLSPEHANGAEAVAGREAKIKRDFELTIKLLAAGKMREARVRFGKTLHTAQDMFARAHTRNGIGQEPFLWRKRDVFRHKPVDESERLSTPNVDRAVIRTQSIYRELEAAFIDPTEGTKAGVTYEQRYNAFLKFRGINR